MGNGNVFYFIHIWFVVFVIYSVCTVQDELLGYSSLSLYALNVAREIHSEATECINAKTDYK